MPRRSTKRGWRQATRSDWTPRHPPQRHGATPVTETPLPSSQSGVGQRPLGTEPAICEPAARRASAGRAWTTWGPARPANARLCGPLGPWWGTDDFLGLPRARGRVSMPSRHGPFALIQKGSWCGSKPVRHRCRKHRRRASGRVRTTWQARKRARARENLSSY